MPSMLVWAAQDFCEESSMARRGYRLTRAQVARPVAEVLMGASRQRAA